MFEPTGPGARDRAERLRRIVRMVRNVNESLTKEVEMVGEGDRKEGEDGEEFDDFKVSILETPWLSRRAKDMR